MPPGRACSVRRRAKYVPYTSHKSLKSRHAAARCGPQNKRYEAKYVL
jgi:hypothetical protein